MGLTIYLCLVKPFLWQLIFSIIQLCVTRSLHNILAPPNAQVILISMNVRLGYVYLLGVERVGTLHFHEFISSFICFPHGQDHKHDVLSDTKEEMTRTVSCLTTSTLGTFPLLYLGSCHGYAQNYVITGICPSSLIPVSNLPLSNHDPYWSRRFSQETPSDFLMTSKPLFHCPLANYPLASLLFSAILDSRAHHNNPPC